MAMGFISAVGAWAPWACGIAAGAGSSAWLLLGWECEDARRCARMVWRVVRREGVLLARAMATCLHAPLRALGVAEKDEGVGLGEVADMADIVRLGLSAGLSFDAALGLYCEGRAGELAERLAHARLSWQVGASTREAALLDVARALGICPLEPFAQAAGRALELGAPLAETLEGQSREMRAAHRAEVERQIERAPVKLLIPTGTLILPALLLSIMGPLLAAGGMM